MTKHAKTDKVGRFYRLDKITCIRQNVYICCKMSNNEDSSEKGGNKFQTFTMMLIAL